MRWYRWLVGAYVGLVVAWLAGRALIFDRWWWLALITTGAPYWLLPLPPLLAVGVWRRQWRWTGPLLIPALAFGAFYGELFLPAFSAPSGEGPTLTLMNYNVLWSNRDFAAFADSVRSAGPDLLGLEELTPGNAPNIVAALEADYPYHTLTSETQGVGLMSRFPIESVTYPAFPPRNLALHAVVNWAGQPIHVFVAHFAANNFIAEPLGQIPAIAAERYATRLEQTQRLAEEFQASRSPALLLCDCNLVSTSEAYQRLDAFLDDSFREAGWGFGFTLTFPFSMQRIDYIWHTAQWSARAAYVGRNGGSDHYPLIAQLQLIPP
jgi:endonuclease/exonuclease/phosphatase (EEP) superfamily protein YafD